MANEVEAARKMRRCIVCMAFSISLADESVNCKETRPVHRLIGNYWLITLQHAFEMKRLLSVLVRRGVFTALRDMPKDP